MLCHLRMFLCPLTTVDFRESWNHTLNITTRTTKPYPKLFGLGWNYTLNIN